MANPFQSLFQYGQEWSGRLVDLLGQLSDASVPAGGTTGQVLEKASNADYDTEWASGRGSQTVKWVDLGVIDWAAVFTNGPTLLYTLLSGEALASIRYLDDVFTQIDVIPLTGFAGIGTTRSFSWWSFAPTRFAPSIGDGTPEEPLDTIGLFVRNYSDTIKVAGGTAILTAIPPPTGPDPLGISYGPDLEATFPANNGGAQVLSAVGDVQAAFAFQNGGGFSRQLAGIGAWEADTAYGLIQDPSPTFDLPPVKAAVIGNGTVWFNLEFTGTAGTSGGSEPDFAGNAGGTVADGPDIVWTDTSHAPTTAGQIHAVAEIITGLTITP